jgi:hypothetical protein
MIVSGTIIALFVVYHLLHFTAQTTAINLTGQNFVSFHDAQNRHDVFKMVVVGFRQEVVLDRMRYQRSMTSARALWRSFEPSCVRRGPDSHRSFGACVD